MSIIILILRMFHVSCILYAYCDRGGGGGGATSSGNKVYMPPGL